jgi:hypothetical protein
LRYDPPTTDRFHEENFDEEGPLCSVLPLLLLAAAVTGCSRYYWSKPGATAEQFTQDNQACVQQAAGTLPGGGASLDAIRQYYRACLNSRGYVRDKQLDPPPPGSYRGIENSEEFNAAAQAAMPQGPRQGFERQSFEQQLAQLDDLKARGRITDDEYATMRKRLVEGVTPAALTPPPPVAVAPVPAVPAPRSLAGRWYGRDGSVLEIRGDGRQLEWDWELVADRVMRAIGTGSASGDQVSLIGRPIGFVQGGSLQAHSFSLTWDGPVLRGSSSGPNNVPRGAEFRRERP